MGWKWWGPAGPSPGWATGPWPGAWEDRGTCLGPVHPQPWAHTREAGNQEAEEVVSLTPLQFPLLGRGIGWSPTVSMQHLQVQPACVDPVTHRLRRGGTIRTHVEVAPVTVLQLQMQVAPRNNVCLHTDHPTGTTSHSSVHTVETRQGWALRAHRVRELNSAHVCPCCRSPQRVRHNEHAIRNI